MCRALRKPNGSVVMIGHSGVGRRSISQLASHICGYKFATIGSMHQSRSESEFRSEIKPVCLNLLNNNASTVLYISESQLFKPSLLDDISSIINDGDITSFFSPEEINDLYDDLQKKYFVKPYYMLINIFLNLPICL